MPALDFQLRSLIKLTGLNSNQSRLADRVRELKVESPSEGVYKITLKIDNNYPYVEVDNINVAGVSGLATGSFALDSLEDSDKLVIQGATIPTLIVSYFELYKNTYDAETEYFLKAYIPEGNTLVVGSQVVFDELPVSMAGMEGLELTVFSANNYTLTFKTNQLYEPPFGLDIELFTELYPPMIPPETYPLPSPNTIQGAGAEALIILTNGFVPASLEQASVSPTTAITDGYLTDHNRRALRVSYEEVEEVDRTVDGTLRYIHNASKMRFSVSWNDLPADSSGTVDGFLSGKEMLDLYNTNKGTFYIEVYNRNSARKDSSGPDVRKLVRFKDFNYDIVKRNFVLSETGMLTDIWEVDMALEEV